MIEHSYRNIVLVFLEDIKILRKVSLWRNVYHRICRDLREVVMVSKEFYKPILVKIQEFLVALKLGIAIEH